MVHYRSLKTCYSCFSVLCVWALATLVAAPAGAETISLSQEAFQRAKQVTVGILADTRNASRGRRARSGGRVPRADW